MFDYCLFLSYVSLINVYMFKESFEFYLNIFAYPVKRQVFFIWTRSALHFIELKLKKYLLLGTCILFVYIWKQNDSVLPFLATKIHNQKITFTIAMILVFDVLLIYILTNNGYARKILIKYLFYNNCIIAK